MAVKKAADLEKNQGRERKDVHHLFEHAEKLGQYYREQDYHREKSESQNKERIRNRRHDLATNLVLMLEQRRQVGQDLLERPRFFPNPHHADIQLVEQPR